MVLKSIFGKKDTTKPSGNSVPGIQKENSRAKIDNSEALQNQTQNGAVELSNPNEPPPALHLEQAMFENARSDNADTRRKVYQELLFSDLLLSLADPDPSQADTDTNASAPADPKDPNSLSVAILQNSAGIQFASAFTSATAARRWRAEGGQYVSVRGQDIFKLLEASPAEVIVINAGSAPFVVLPKVEYRQLAMGVVPQGGPSPVQVAAAPEEAPGAEGQGSAEAPNDQMQVAFPPDVFNDEQKAHAAEILRSSGSVLAAALGAILPPGAGENGWIRTVFIRVEGIEETQESMQNFCASLRTEIASNEALFNEVGFEVGVMPDPNFWVAMHQNSFALFDKNPPEIPAAPAKEGVVDASLS